MEKITITNSRGSVEIGNTFPYTLTNIQGITGLQTDVITQKAYQQDGETYIDANYRPRNIVVSGLISAESYETLNTYKRIIQNLFCPRISTKLTYTNETYTKDINVIVETTPVFSNNEKSKYSQSFFVSLIAHQPFFEDTEESGETFSLSLGKFKFPLKLTNNYKIETTGINRTTFENGGDVKTPVKILFLGPASNPKILNETTGVFVKINKTLLTNEKLEINTEFGNVSVLFYDSFGAVTNAFDSIDLGSDFTNFNLETGSNIISFEVDSGIQTAKVNITYKNRFVGL